MSEPPLPTSPDPVDTVLAVKVLNTVVGMCGHMRSALRAAGLLEEAHLVDVAQAAAEERLDKLQAALECKGTGAAPAGGRARKRTACGSEGIG